MSKPTQAHDARTCPQCGKEFTPRNKAQRYCTNRNDGPGSCQKMAERERERQRGRKVRKVPMLCHYCGAEFMGEKRKRIKGSREHYYCSHRCYSDYRSWGFRKQFSSPLKWQECRDCNQRFIARHGRHSCNKCRTAKTPSFVSGHCLECGKPYVGSWHPTFPARFCSNQCAKKQNKGHRRRAQRYGVAYEPINRVCVFERDNYLCRLCGNPTDPTAKVPHPNSPTIDHKIPMSKGGPHLYENVQCACFDCNWKKGARLSSESVTLQLGLRFSSS